MRPSFLTLFLLCISANNYADEGHSLQVGAYQNLENAQQEVTRLGQLDITATLYPVKIVDKGLWHKLIVSHHRSKNSALDAKHLYQQKTPGSVYIVKSAPFLKSTKPTETTTEEKSNDQAVLPEPALATTASTAKLATQQTSRAIAPDPLQKLFIVLEWPTAVHVTEQTQNANELLLHFDQPLLEKHFLPLDQQFSDWINNAQYGYDSLLLKLKPGVTASFASNGGSVDIELIQRDHANGQTKPIAATTVSNNERLTRLHAKLNSQTGEVQQSKQQLKQLLAFGSPNPDLVLADLAEIEWQTGRWKKALQLYNQAIEFAPNKPFLVERKQQLLAQQAPIVSIKANREEIGDEHHNVYQLATKTLVSPTTEVGLSLDHRQISPALLVDPTLPSSANDFQRTRAYFSAEIDHPSNGYSQWGIDLSDSSIGASAGYSHYAWGGTFNYDLKYNTPYWKLLEGIYHSATSDRVSLSHTNNWHNLLYWELKPSYNSYRIDGDSMGNSWSLDGYVRHFVHRWAPLVTVTYSLDKEQVNQIHSTLPNSGNRYQPLPLFSKEIHTLAIAWSDVINNGMNFSFNSGYSHDRLNDGSFFLGGELFYKPSPRVEVGVHFWHSLATFRASGDDYNLAGLFLKIR